MSLREFLFYEEPGIALYCGDARKLLPMIEQPDTCITDPVWPNSVFPNVDDPTRLLAEMAKLLTTERVVIHLGCMSDPRFLAAVPERYPFLRTCWLRYARPNYNGRILNSGDVAYAFGVAPPSRPGRRVLSGEVTAHDNRTKLQASGRGSESSDVVDYSALPHPCPRQYEHVAWLVKTFADAGVIDPACGTGVTLEAAKNAELCAIGIEIEPRYCEIAVKRLRQEVLPLAQPPYPATGKSGRGQESRGGEFSMTAPVTVGAFGKSVSRAGVAPVSNGAEFGAVERHATRPAREVGQVSRSLMPTTRSEPFATIETLLKARGR